MASKKQEAQTPKRGQTRQPKVGDRSARIAENRRTSHPILQLQRQVGNAAVTREIKRRQDSPPQANQGRIQREEEVGLFETIMRGGRQLLKGDFGGLAETAGVSDTIDNMSNDPIDTSLGLFGDGLQWMEDHPFGLVGDWLGYGREDE